MYTTRVILWYPPKKGVQYPLIDNLLYQVTFFSHLMVLSSYCAIPTSHVTVFFLTFGDSFFFSSHLTVPFSHYVVLTSHVTIFLSHLVFPYYFFSHLTISSLHCARPTSHVTVLLSHLVILYFFLTFHNSIFTLCSSNITCDNSLVIFGGSFIFFSSNLMVLLLY